MKKFLIAAALILVGAFVICRQSGSASMPSVEIGKKAPAFTLKDADGKERSLNSFLSAKYTVVMFIATQCPISNAYNERMAALNKDYASKDIAFVGINSNKQESAEEVKEHAAENGFAFPVLKDWNNVVADAYGAQVTPEVFVLDQQATVLYHGRIDDSRNEEKIKTQDLSVTLDALLAGKSVPKPETKAFGCTIKRIKKES
ncbi:MAG: thioredoxin family protein [Ignavibacteriae bacterium]|nr:thioredoxin family protein [Ignavibacteriota bacterium]